MWMFLRNNDLLSKKHWFSSISQSKHDILGMIDDNSLKTPVIPLKLVWIDRIRWTLQTEHKNMCMPLRNNDLFSKTLCLSCFSPTEQDILGMTEDNALLTRVIPLNLDWIDRIHWNLQAECKNMCIFLRINDLFSKKRRFSCISCIHSENDILGMTDDKLLKARVILSKLFSIDGIRLTLQAGYMNMRVSVRNSDLFSEKLRFSYISNTEDEILCMISDNSLKTVVIPSKLASFCRFRWTLHAERKNVCFSVRNTPLQIYLAVLENHNNYEASKSSKRTAIPSQPVGLDAALHVCLHMISRHIISHIISNWPRFHLYYFTASNKYNRITVS